MVMRSKESEALKEHYQGTVAILSGEPNLDLALNRALLDLVHVVAAEPTGVSYDEVRAGDRPAIWCIPERAKHDRVVVYFHGGGFVVQSVHSHRKLAGHLAKAAGCRVLLLDYRRAPEHTYPAQIDDVQHAFSWLIDKGLSPSRIAFAGDSAGACLAISATVRLRDAGTPLPAAIIGFSPWFDLECDGPTLSTNCEKDALVQRPLVEEMAMTYLGQDVSPSDPRANPLHSDLSGFPPVYLTAGSDEALLDNGERFAKRARSQGVDVTFEVEPGQQHVFQFMAGRAPEADRSIAAAGVWVAERLETAIAVEA
jgi:epsilon-lactone hydrolase